MLKPKMPLQLQVSKPFTQLLLISLLLVLSHGSMAAADDKFTNIGAIINLDSRAGKEEAAAMAIAVKNFNNNSEKNKLFIHFMNGSGEPLQAASAAEQLIKEKRVQVIIGMQTWQEAALVANVGQQAEVPVISLASAAIAPPLTQLRWPFLVRMASNASEEINCIAAIVHSYNWRRVIVIYEEDMYGGESGMLASLFETLQKVGSQIEHRLVLPPFSSPFNPKGLIREEVEKLLRKESRVFIIIQSSLQMAKILLSEAKKLGLMGRDSVWIISDTVASLLDSVPTSVISTLPGALGIKTYYSEDSESFLEFKAQFRKKFRLDYPEEDNLEPGIHALRAYDSITAIARAMKKVHNDNSNTSKMILKEILSSNFTGLSGDIHFKGGMLLNIPIFRIVNVVGKKYKELGFWSSEIGFSESLSIEKSGKKNSSMKMLSGLVNWPGDLSRVPKGWAMPSDAQPMKIGVPGRTSFEKFVKVEWVENSNKKIYSGFCIDVFEEVLRILGQSYTLPYEFVPYNGTYDDLVDHVINKTFDAVVGDVTILANRSIYVEFTQPFTESGLSMLVPVKSEAQKAWMFMKPFTKEMWIVTCAILFYTMFIVWFLEHQSNPEFKGPWKDQLGTALWFTFSSLFFSHREKIHSNYTRVVVVVWLFVVLVLTSSYTANLTSILTVPRLEPNVTDIEWLKKTNATVGCDGDSFVKNYLKTVLDLQNIKNISSQHDYPGEFDSGNISAAFLELPYEKVFLNEYCNGYTATGPTYKFGGLGFVFPKGSPIAVDVSEAILILSENGELKRLENEWLGSSLNCSNSDTTTKTDSLSLESFWGIYVVSGAVSTICLFIFLVSLMLQRYGYNGGTKSLERAPTFAHAPDLDEWSSSGWELVSPSDTSEHLEVSPQAEIQLSVNI